jgi:hypothetical protein
MQCYDEEDKRAMDAWNYFFSWDKKIPVDIQCSFCSRTLPPCEDDGSFRHILDKAIPVFQKYILEVLPTQLDRCSRSFKIGLLAEEEKKSTKRAAFTLPQEQETIQKYVKYCLRFLFYLIRLWKHKEPFSLPEKDDDMIFEFVNALVIGENELEQLHALLANFLLKKLPLDVSEEEVVIYQFMILSSINEGGSKIHKETISSNFAMLKFLIRCTAVVELTKKYSCSSMNHEEILLVTQERDSVNSPFAIVSYEMGGLHYAIQAKKFKPDFVWKRSHDNTIDHKRMLIGDCDLGLDDIKTFVKSLLESVDIQISFIRAEFDLKLWRFHQLIKILDDLHNEDPGYSFSTSREKDTCHRISQTIANKPKYFLRSSVERGLILQQSTVRPILSKIEEINMLLLILAHVTGGQPGRTTELLASRLKNHKSGCRSVYLVDGQICLMQGKFKSYYT